MNMKIDVMVIYCKICQTDIKIDAQEEKVIPGGIIDIVIRSLKFLNVFIYIYFQLIVKYNLLIK